MTGYADPERFRFGAYLAIYTIKEAEFIVLACEALTTVVPTATPDRLY